MPAYIVATITITDATRFAEYSKGIAGMSERFGGEAIVKGAVTEVLEGASEIGERIVVSRFPDAAAARAYVGSPEYREASSKRAGAAVVTMRLIETPA